MHHINATKSLIGLGMASMLAGFASIASASAFQLWEQGEADLGNYHAGAAAIAEDSSTEYYNPAGLVRLKQQEISVGTAAILMDINYRGTAKVNTVNHNVPQYASVNGGKNSFIPNLHYALPLGNRFAFGFGITVPLGLESDYGTSTPLRYVGTVTTVQAINIGPSLGFRINKNFSLGFGLDAQRLKSEFDEYAGYSTISGADTSLTNKAYDWAYGYHLGALYEFTPSIRIGLSYRSKIVHHAEGFSEFSGKLANPTYASSQDYRTNKFTTDLIMPATTILSFYQDLTPSWAWMASATYTEWGSFNALVLEHVTGKGGTTTTTIDVPQNFRNTWNVAVGATYKFNPKWQFKFGLGCDETPVTSAYRTIQLPDNNRYVAALGVHWQPVQMLGFDLGYAHFFLQHANINSTIRVNQEIATANGVVHSYASAIGLQITVRV